MLKSIFFFTFFLYTTMTSAQLSEGLYTKITTNKGIITLKLFYDKTPITVANFAGLAEGLKENSIKKNKPFYDGLTFHRVINDFMIQGGDPLGNGSGGPGYNFIDEFDPSLKHNKAGVLSMANSGANTNGSQFFITHKETPWLDGKHTVFGEVVSGMDVVNAIVQGDVMEKVEIIRIGDKAKDFKTDEKSFQQIQKNFTAQKQDNILKDKEIFNKYVKENYPNSIFDSGIYYQIDKNGSNDKIKSGDKLEANYIITLTDGTVLMDSKKENKPLVGTVGVGNIIKGLDIGLLNFSKNSSGTIIAPYYLAFGDQVIKGSKQTIIFKVEIIEVN